MLHQVKNVDFNEQDMVSWVRVLNRCTNLMKLLHFLFCFRHLERDQQFNVKSA